MKNASKRVIVSTPENDAHIEASLLAYTIRSTNEKIDELFDQYVDSFDEDLKSDIWLELNDLVDFRFKLRLSVFFIQRTDIVLFNENKDVFQDLLSYSVSN